jgi:hypothetical protein
MLDWNDGSTIKRVPTLATELGTINTHLQQRLSRVN